MAPGRYDPGLRVRAREMREAGMSVSRIAHELGVRSTSVVHRWVADIAPPAWTRRPNAKDGIRDQARLLRLGGASLKVIAQDLGVATSTVSVWVRDLPVPEGLRRRASHANRINGDRWLKERARREEDRQQVKAAGAQIVGQVSDRELMLLGAVLYWAEGAKDKPYARRENVAFINSDPAVIVMFLRWLDLMGVPAEHRAYRLSIHESADIDAAHRFWSAVIDVEVEVFARPTLKRHQPKTVRLNVGQNYHGCLVIRVRQSRVLYQTIEGLFAGVAADMDRGRHVRETGTGRGTV